jgi:hypothetical protein
MHPLMHYLGGSSLGGYRSPMPDAQMDAIDRSAYSQRPAPRTCSNRCCGSICATTRASIYAPGGSTSLTTTLATGAVGTADTTTGRTR